MATNGGGFDAAKRAAQQGARKAQKGLDQISDGRRERGTSGETGGDIAQRNIDRAKQENWNAPRSPR